MRKRNKMRSTSEASSFRDPSGFIFNINGKLYRQVNTLYKTDFDNLIKSGLYDELTNKKLLIGHRDVTSKINFETENGYKIIQPEVIPFVSYPFEWCFSELKDAALLTLQIQKIALKYNMSLKDASAFNVQFMNGKPILIDTLSIENYKEDKPWIAYKQFCQHFLAPLALMSLSDLSMNKMSEIFLDGIPLEIASKLLPFRTKFSLGLGAHIHLHAKSKTRGEKGDLTNKTYHLNKNRLIAIVDNLEKTILGLKLPKQRTEWHDYYQNTNYTKKAMKLKKEIIASWIKKIKPTSVWDSGSNDGTFSELASKAGIRTIATDIDPLAIEYGYNKAKVDNNQQLLHLIIDLTNPSPAIGWGNKERKSFLERSDFDLTLCLAFIHHLAISNNLPFSYVAELYSQNTKHLIIEFVPKNDSNTQRLLASREDVFVDYNKECFEKEFKKFFNIDKSIIISGSDRILYLMEKR